MRSEEISNFLQERIDAGDFPSAVYLVGEKGEIILEDALGNAVVEPEVIPARMDTIYDVASMTKVLVTGLLCAQMAEKGWMNLQDPVAKYFPQFDTDEKRAITIQHLLTHTSGLPAWRPFYLMRDASKATQDDLAQIIGGLPLEYPTGSKVVYSDPNFILLTLLIGKVYGHDLEEAWALKVFFRLFLHETFFNPSPDLIPRIAASEKGNEFEKQTCIEMGYDVSGYNWRDYQIWGEVHDGNAWAMGGVSGHAGLFSTADEVFKIAGQFLPGYSKLLQPETCRLFSTNLTPGLNESRSIAFQTAAVTRETAGERLPHEAFGHLGFTGTSLWIDPIKERIYILLTNRTHARALPFENINSVRRRFHDTAAKILDEDS